MMEWKSLSTRDGPLYDPIQAVDEEDFDVTPRQEEEEEQCHTPFHEGRTLCQKILRHFETIVVLIPVGILLGVLLLLWGWNEKQGSSHAVYDHPIVVASSSGSLDSPVDHPCQDNGPGFLVAFAHNNGMAMATTNETSPHHLRQGNAATRHAMPTRPRTVRVIVLAGQSNMVGHGVITSSQPFNQSNATLAWLVQHVPHPFNQLVHQPETDTTHVAPKDWNWTVRDNILMACNRRKDYLPVLTYTGHLTASLCGGDEGQFQIGPELGLGWALADHLDETNTDERIVVLKVAWGGTSLAKDWLPPSATNGTAGPLYQSMVANVKAALVNMEYYFPKEFGRNAINSSKYTFQLAGFAWHQGWQDGCDETMAAAYESNLVHLIQDLRHDFTVPNLPIVVGASGMLGYSTTGRRQVVIDAQLAVANATKYPAFAGNVASVDTRPFSRDPAPASPSDFGFHWNNNAESYWLVGYSMGQAMIELISSLSKTEQKQTPKGKEDKYNALRQKEQSSEPQHTPDTVAPRFDKINSFADTVA